MKRIHYLLLGLLVSLTIAAVSPTVPPTRLTAGGNITIVTNSLNNFTLSGSVTNYGQNFTNVTIYGTATNALNIPGTNRVGIGTSAHPLAPLHVGDRDVNHSSDAVILISRQVDNDTVGNGHAFSDSSSIGRSGGIGYNSYDARVNFTSTQDYDHYAGFQVAPAGFDVGVMQNYYGIYDKLDAPIGYVKNEYGYYKATSVGTTTRSNVFGVYIEAQTIGTNGNWGIYTAGTTPSFFGGPVQVGGKLTTTNANIYTQTNYGSILPATTSTYEIGSAAAGWLRVRADQVVAPIVKVNNINDATDAITHFYLNATDARFGGGKFQFNGTSASFPALVRSTEYLNIIDAAGGNTAGLMINSGTPILGVLSASAALNFDLTLVVVQDLTLTVTGAADGDTVSLGVPNGSVTTSVQYTGWVSAANTVTIRARTSAAGENPASGTFRATVTKF
jgi:hypothetical protein